MTEFWRCSMPPGQLDFQIGQLFRFFQHGRLFAFAIGSETLNRGVPNAGVIALKQRTASCVATISLPW
jgi:hypothetical protein